MPWWNWRVSFVGWTVGALCAFYGVCALLYLRWIDKLFFIHCSIGSGPILDDETRRLMPIGELILLASYLPASLCAYSVYSRLRRRWRERHDLCTECGRPIDDWHGRCPGCGVRLGPDAGNVVHVIRCVRSIR